MALNNVMEADPVRRRGGKPIPTVELTAPPMSPGSSDQLLVEAVRRAVRHPERRMALVLHLSRLAPPAPRPHHRRIARAILEDTAQRHEGQVFTLRNGDMVLLCRAAEFGRETRSARQAGRQGARRPALPDPAALPEALSRLMRADAADPARLTTVWRLEHEPEAVASYAAARAAETAAPPRSAPAATCPGRMVRRRPVGWRPVQRRPVRRRRWRPLRWRRGRSRRSAVGSTAWP